MYDRFICLLFILWRFVNIIVWFSYFYIKFGGNMGFKLDWLRKVWRERMDNFCYKIEGKKNKYVWIEKVKLIFRFFFLEGR